MAVTSKKVTAGDDIKAADHNALVDDVKELDKTAAKGDKGDTGAQGPQGEPGPAGKDGTNGTDGAKGDKGATGSAGKDAENQFTDEQKEALLALIEE